MGINYKENNQWKGVKVKVGDNIPVGAEFDYDGQTVPVGYEEVADKGEIYSTTETKIGTWIDNKPLYKKVITGVIDNTASNWQVIETISTLNIDTLIIDSATLVEYNDGEYRVVHELPYHDRVTYAKFVHLYISKGSNVEILVPSSYINDFVNCKIIVILKYTKTTD